MIRRLTPFVITGIVVAAVTVGVINYTTPQRFGLEFAPKATSGKVALTEQQMRDIVVGEGLTLYWLGPESGAQYALISVNEHQNYVRYLPGGEGLNDAGANFRVVGTYQTKDAFKVTQNDAKSPNGIGLVSPDGNAIYLQHHPGLKCLCGR